MELRAPVLVETGSQPLGCVLSCLLLQVLNRWALCCMLVEAGAQPWSCVLLCLLRQVLNRGAACYRACCCRCSTVGLRAPVLVEAGSQPWSCVLLCLLRQVLNCCIQVDWL